MISGGSHPPDQRDGAAIRRLDWRFLLPVAPRSVSRRLLLLGASDSVASAALDLGVAGAVIRSPHTRERADVAALLGGRSSRADLDGAIATLDEDGILYIEVARRSRRNVFLTPARLARGLASRGFGAMAIYWVKPDLDAAEMYLPSRPPRAFSWYLESLYTPITLLRRAARSILRALPRRLFWASVPAFAVVARRTGPVGPALFRRDEVETAVNDSSAILLTDNGERAVLVAVSPRGPRRIVKVAKRPEFGDKTRHEHAVLEQLHDRLDATLAKTIPRPVALWTEAGLPAAEESVVEGSAVLSRVGTWPFAAGRQVQLLDRATAWLVAFHASTNEGAVNVTSPDAAQWLWVPMTEYRERFAPTPAEGLLERRLRSFAEAKPVRLPLAWEHRDFSVSNIWATGDGVRVIDWEGGRPGPVLADLLYFVAGWHATALGVHSDDAKLKAFQRLFVDRSPSDRLAEAGREAVRRYCLALDISDGLVPLLLARSWCDLALRHRERKAALGEAHADPRRANPYIAYVELIAEHVEQLVETWR